MSDLPTGAERPSAEELHAYADGRLAGDRQSAVEAWLAVSPEDAVRVADYRLLGMELHARFDPVLREAVPEHWLQPMIAERRRWREIAVAAALALTIGAAGGWALRGLQSAPPGLASLATQAAVAHAVYAVEVRHPVEVAASEEAHLVAWLSKRLGSTLKAPRLDMLGYTLIGGRLLPALEGGAAAQLMYESGAGNRVTIYIKAASGDQPETAFRYVADRDGVNVFYWLDGPLGCAVSGRLARDDLLAVARRVYEQLNG